LLVRRVSADAAQLPVDRCGGELAAALGGGFLRGSSVLLSGPRGSGKSTLAMEALVQLQRVRGGLLWWLDRDQGDDRLIAHLCARMGGDLDALRIVRPPPGSSLTWRDALAAVPDDAPAFVLDSLFTWGGRSMVEQDRIVTELMDDPTDRVALVIQRWNKGSEPVGHADAQYDVDADVHVYEERLEVRKCRWTPPTLRAFPREARSEA
jgi:hypothetical protein